ncbi:hypothetical protein BGX38DRAFT_1267931 [Terfezia claveryi]|nr:hypothetical protein BGX38DRAFT_1267931 [Terfezia claveryi]
MNAVRSRPVQRAWRNLPVCPAGTRGRILKRRVSSSSHAAAEAQARGAPGEGRDPMWNIISLPKISRRNPALSWASPSPPDTTDKAYLQPNPTPPAISRLLRAIDSRSPEAIWHHFSLLTPSERARLSPQHLSHILLSLRPKKHLPIASRAYLDHYHPSYSPSLSSIPLARLPKRQHAINWLLSRVAAVLAEYHANNIPLGTAEYAHLLDVARAKEDVRMARELWAEMDARGVQKDTKCYNTYIAALCGTMLTEGTWKTNARTVGVRARRDFGMRGGEAQEKVGDVGVAALRVWEVMLKDGCVPDMATFEFVLGAVARMGNLPVMKVLVWRAWGVDISAPSFDTRPNPTQIQETEPDLSTSTTNAERSPPRQFTSNRPPPPPPSEPPPLYIRPNPQTLTSLAAIISRLSHPSLAIRLINYLSITYNLTIPTATWQHLLVWTYVYTRPPRGHACSLNLP